MRQLLATVAVAVLVGLGVRSTRADAEPPCVPTNEKIQAPISSASFNGEPGVPPTDGSGLYVTDGGAQFHVATLPLVPTLEAAPIIGATTCPLPAEELTLTIADPWTGQRIVLELRGTP